MLPTSPPGRLVLDTLRRQLFVFSSTAAASLPSPSSSSSNSNSFANWGFSLDDVAGAEVAANGLTVTIHAFHETRRRVGTGVLGGWVAAAWRRWLPRPLRAALSLLAAAASLAVLPCLSPCLACLGRPPPRRRYAAHVVSCGSVADAAYVQAAVTLAALDQAVPVPRPGAHPSEHEYEARDALDAVGELRLLVLIDTGEEGGGTDGCGTRNERRDAAAPASAAAASRAATQGRGLLERFRRVVGLAGAGRVRIERVVEIEGTPGHAARVVREEMPDLTARVDVVVCVGGDALIHEVVNGLNGRHDGRVASGIPIAVVPVAGIMGMGLEGLRLEGLRMEGGGGNGVAQVCY